MCVAALRLSRFFEYSDPSYDDPTAVDWMLFFGRFPAINGFRKRRVLRLGVLHAS